MELLAPAGDMEQALKSIEAGCDAIYGGLKGWNARHRAKNFSMSEYNQILEVCHNRNIKFYLTLNTLFRDEELNKVRNLFRSADFPYPDAVIVADIGLMRMLYREFPDVVLHASTQFGACSLEDLIFLKQFNVRRAVLARELTLSEIYELRKKTDVELEVFVYGSQCICFSGQCIWGGLINACSGNRGRCTGMCRDFYIKDTRMGQFMYPQDIDAVDILGSLKNMGINSIKIEGRIRDSNETEDAVKHFREALDRLPDISSQGEKKYMGYLSNSVPVKNMLNAVNPRFLFPPENSSKYGEQDILYVDKPVPGVYNGVTVGGQECSFLMSLFSDKWMPDDMAVSVSVYFRDRFIERVVAIDGAGNRWKFDAICYTCDYVKMTTLYWYFVDNMKVRMYEFLSNVPQNEMVNVDWDVLTDIIQKICELCECKNTDTREINHETPISLNLHDYVMQTDNVDDIELLQNMGVNKYIFEIKSRKGLVKAIQKEKAGVVAVYKLPILDFNHVMEDILLLLREKHVLICKPSQLILGERYGFSRIYADYTVNVWNTYAAEVLKEYDVVSFTAHPELSAEYSYLLSQNAGLPCSIISKGNLPLGFTRACFNEIGLCNGKCENSVFYLENLTKGYGIEIRCDNEFGYRKIVGTSFNISYMSEYAMEFRCIFNGLRQVEEENIAHGNLPNNLNLNLIYRRNVR